MIPTPRSVISVAFSGPGKKTLYVVGAGALGPDGQEFRTPEGVRNNAKTPAEREAVCNALIFKTNVLWVQLDALYHAYVEGHIPPGAFVPKTSG